MKARSADADVKDCQYRIEKDPDNIKLREEMIELQNKNYKIGAEKYKHDFAKLANETVGKKYTKSSKFLKLLENYWLKNRLTLKLLLMKWMKKLLTNDLKIMN